MLSRLEAEFRLKLKAIRAANPVGLVARLAIKAPSSSGSSSLLIHADVEFVRAISSARYD
jgi:hypothetical protein